MREEQGEIRDGSNYSTTPKEKRKNQSGIPLLNVSESHQKERQ